MVLRFLPLFLAVLMPFHTVFAREISEISVDLPAADPGESKQEALDRATEEATRKMVSDALGAERTTALWAQIGPKILKSSGRFLLSAKVTAQAPVAAGSKTTVVLRISPDNLDSLLKEMGLFAGGTVRLLPLLTVVDSRGVRYAWWAEGDDRQTGPAQDYFKKIYHQIQTQFRGKSIFVLDPLSASFRAGVPSSYRTELLRREDQALLAQYLKADVLLTGKVEVVRARPDAPEHKVDYSVELWQARNLRGVAELAKSDPVPTDAPKSVGATLDMTGKKLFGELAARLSEAVNGGTLNLAVMRIQVNGLSSYKQQTDFKNQLADLREIRAVKERLLEPGRVTYEVETPTAAAELARSLQRVHFTGFTVAVEAAPDNGLVLNVRATSAQ